MRSHQSRQRRKQRGSRVQEEDQILVSRTEDSHSESYSHTRPTSNSRHSESYRTPSSDRTSSYEMGREPSSSRINHEHPESWHPEPVEDRYSAAYHASDSYHRRGSRDGYDIVDSREDWRPRRNSESHYPQQQREEWPSRYRDGGHESYSSYQESATWDPQSAPSYDDRLPYSRWPEENGATRHDEHDYYRQRDQRGGRRERDTGWDKHTEERQSDMGWVPRQRESGRRPWEEGNVFERPRSPVPERSWEPAESWKSSHSNDPPDNHRSSQRNNGYNKQHKGGHRKNHQQNKNRKDWKNDDSHLNNWHKRDNHTTERNMKQTSRKKHPRSQSRSRSPAESYYSHYSSKARSRSRSLSPAPKRARRESSPFVRLQETPQDSAARRKDTSYTEKRSVSPPRHSRKTRKIRKRSLSSVSTVSSDRSRSHSPDTRPRAVHRLPTASTTGPNHSRPNIPNENKSRKHYGRNHKSSLAAIPSSEQMPPPSLPYRPLYDDAQSPVSSSATSAPLPPPLVSASVTEDRNPNQARMGPIKHAGFKPIVHRSAPSSLKKFFPGDDEDMDVSNDSSSSSRVYEAIPEDRASEREARRDQDFEHHNSVDMLEPSTRDSHAIHSGPGLHAGKLEHQFYSPHRDIPDRQPNDEEQIAPSTRDGSFSEPLPTSSSVPPTSAPGEVYSIVSQVGEGTFGKVYKARNTYSGTHVALKRIRMETEKEGFPVTAMREIKLLQSLRHDNVVRLHEMMVSSGSVYMVFEYMDHDLTGVLSQTQFLFSDAHLKSLCHQMLAGLGYLHHKGVIHRDIKGSNILINNRGELKLGDFGLARFYQKRRRADYTNRVITLWYRPPELLFGATIYGPEVDMWSAGCIMLELFTKKPVFQGNDEISQLDVIYRIIGTPNRERWADIANLPWYELVKPKDAIPNHFRDLFRKWMSPAALDLAERLLDYNPSQRITASQALEAPYFITEEPPPSPPVGLATLEGEWHELETKRERAKKRRKE